MLLSHDKYLYNVRIKKTKILKNNILKYLYSI